MDRIILCIFLLVFSLLSLEGRELSPRILSPQAYPKKQKKHTSQFDAVVLPRPPKSLHRKWIHRKRKYRRHNRKQGKKEGSKQAKQISRKDFVALEAAALEYRQRWSSARFRTERKALQKKSKEFFKKYWPQKKYRFADACALYFVPSLQKKHRPFWRFQVGKNGRCSHTDIRLRKIKNDGIFSLLKTAKTPVFLKAALFLQKIRFSALASDLKKNSKKRGQIYWKWKPLHLSFRDPYLQALYRKYRPRRLPKIRGPLQKARDLPLFFSVLAKEQKRKSPEELEAFVDRYLPKGGYLWFGRDCPLRFLDGMREAQRRMLQFQVEAGCLTGKRRRFVMLLPTDSPAADFFQNLRPESLFSARLRFQEILWEGNQFYPLWDTILKPKGFSNPKGLPLRFFAP